MDNEQLRVQAMLEAIKLFQVLSLGSSLDNKNPSDVIDLAEKIYVFYKKGSDDEPF